ncbi:MAG: hypothetical protein AB1705_12720 [Verrucomicrobiota bacterium]
MKPSPLMVCMVALLSAGAAFAGPLVSVERAPEGGLQPQAVVDDKGTVHLVYLKGLNGEWKSCDILYVRREAGKKEFSQPIRVNSQAGSATAGGTIRGAQIAVGRNGRAHVAWNGPHVHGQKDAPPAPMLYSRLNDAGTAFEPQRNLMTWTAGLDGGGSVAADLNGNVYVTWHGRDGKVEGGKGGEVRRTVFVAKSKDDGKTFAREVQAVSQPTGACGCCGMRAYATPSGSVFALYRSASTAVNRDMMLLASRDGQDFQVATAHKWNIGSCPMSSAFLSSAKADVLAAWETNGQVFYSRINPATLKLGPPIAPGGGGEKRKHPVVVANRKGEVLMAWAEGTGWQKGGALAWQVFDASGRPTEEKGRADGVPVFSLETAYVDANDRFVIIY